MASVLSKRIALAFAPPRYLAPPAAGVDISASGIKFAVLKDAPHGLELATYEDLRIPAGAFENGDIMDRAALAAVLREAAQRHHVGYADVSLPESKSYIFETQVEGRNKEEWRTLVEQHLDEYVPIAPADAAFDVVPVGERTGGMALVGIAYAARVVEETLSLLQEAGITARSLESETFTLARSILPFGDRSTVLVIDIGQIADAQG